MSIYLDSQLPRSMAYDPYNPPIVAYWTLPPDNPAAVERVISAPSAARLRQMCSAVYRRLGKRLPEVVYQNALTLELYNAGAARVTVEQQLPLVYRDSHGDERVIHRQRADIIAEYSSGDTVLIEVKANSRTGLSEMDRGQAQRYTDALTYLKRPPTLVVLVNFSYAPAATDVGWEVMPQPLAV